MGKIIGPDEVATKDKPVLFISGTFRGSKEWTSEAVRMLRIKGVTVALNNFHSRRNLHEKFETCLEWGEYHIRQALQSGLVLIWFSERKSRIPANTQPHLFDNPYSANAMYELGRCLEHKKHKKRARIVVGCDTKYDRQNAIVDRVRLADVGLTTLIGSIDDVCEKVLIELSK